jgi:pyrroline-5-carboxylate reductase
MLNATIGLIGAGQMATALGQGLVKSGLVAKEQILASDPLESARERFSRAVGARTTADNLDVVTWAQILILAVKPQQMPEVLSQIRGRIGPGHLVVSIAAGIPCSVLLETLGPETRLARVMPNTPCLVGRGACAYCLGGTAAVADGEVVSQILSAVGIAIEVNEKLMDAVTGLSGSGPAFAYVVIEALSDGGVRMGLPRHVATTLAAQTLRGAATMVLCGNEHPAVLKDRVASPGGTTIAGLQALESGGLRAALIAAVEAATRRAAELASGA